MLTSTSKLERANLRAETVAHIVQIIAIVLAGAWGIFMFYRKEIAAPRSAPVNVTVELELEHANTASFVRAENGDKMLAIQFKIVARNPSSRTIQLLPSAFSVYGIALKYGNEQFEQALQQDPVPTSGRILRRHVSLASATLLATGRPFLDKALNPSEVIARTLTLYVPENTYDSLEILVMMPSARDTSGLRLTWVYDPVSATPKAEVCREQPNGKCVPLPRDSQGGYPYDRKTELQETDARAQLPLPKLTATR